ncbi:MAG: MoaD/ThiS family protein [Dehalococcoidia bacterium]|nr:MoaD/ThiS family protein [Dehalococcoidia bacterium]MDZ4247230.1 MoaD/ThiS family protein [Dehalococcoidia bacterium]
MARVTIEIYPWLTSYLAAKGQKKGGGVILEQEIEEGENIGTLLRKLAAREKKLGPHLYDPESGRLTDQVGIVLNNRFIDLLDGPDTVLKDGDTVTLSQAWCGG